MNLTMAEDFEKRYLDLLQEGFRDLKKNVDQNTELTQRVLRQAKMTNGRVSKHDEEIASLKKRVHKKWNVQVDNKVLYLMALATVIALAIVAQNQHVNLGGIL